MFRSLWFHKLLGVKCRSVRRRQASQARRAVRLDLEGLEDRITPAGLPFATPGNATQLLADITFANANPNQAVTINLQAGGTYDLTDIGSELVVTSKAGVTINGNGATINAAANNRIFEVDSGDKLVLENVTVTGGNVTNPFSKALGGGILDKGGSVTLSGAIVSGNTARGSGAQGGGIFVSGAGTLTLKNGSQVSNNKAVGSTQFGARGEAKGGGIYVTGGGAVSITNSTISSNLARGGNNNSSTHNRAGGFEAKGGGLFLQGGSVVTIANSTISNNNVQGGNGTGTTGAGGGKAQGGGIYLSGTGWKVSITGTSLSGNTATGGAGAKGGTSDHGGIEALAGGNGGNGGSAAGGGAYVLGLGSGFSILSSSFNGNTAQGGAGGQGGHGTDGGNGGNGGKGGSALGGGLFFETIKSGLTITGTSFDSNQAIGGNGGLGGLGGVGANKGGDGGDGGDAGSADGGGVWLIAGAGTITITNSSVTNNNATAGTGGAGGSGGTGGTTGGAGGQGGAGGTASGGGINLLLGGTDLTVINTTLGANTAQGGNAGVGGVGGLGTLDATHGSHGGAGSAGSAFGGGLENFLDSHIDLINDTIAFNVAQAGSGGSNNPESQGGGVDGHSSVEMINVLLDLNIATDGPDYFGSVGLGSNHDFVSNTDGIANLNLLKFGVGNILNNQNPQLGPLQGPGSNAGDVAWYPLLANSAVINAGSNSVQADIANAQGVPIADITDEIGNPRIINNIIDMGAIEFLVATTSLSVSPVTVTQTSSPTQVQLTATVSSQTGESINEGVVSFSVTDSDGNPVGGTVSNIAVSNGTASASFTVPGNTPVGTYTITATYTDPQNGSSGGRFGPSSDDTHTLTVNATPASTTVKAGNASVDVSTSPQSVNVVALVNSPAGTVNEGTMTVTLFDKTNSPVASGFASVSGGSASVKITVPANFPAGSYQMQESYTDGTDFGGSSDFGTLTVNDPKANNGGSKSTGPVTIAGAVSSSGPVNVSQASGPDALMAFLTITIDAAELCLVQAGITSVAGTQLPSAAALVAQMQANFAFAGPFGMAALAAGINAGNHAVAASK